MDKKKLLLITVFIIIIAIKTYAVDTNGKIELYGQYTGEKFLFNQNFNLNIRDREWSVETNKERGKLSLYQKISDFRFKEYFSTEYGKNEKEGGIDLYYKNLYNLSYVEGISARGIDTKYSKDDFYIRGVYNYLKTTKENEYKLFLNEKLGSIRLQQNIYFLNKRRYNWSIRANADYLEGFVNTSEIDTIVGAKYNWSIDKYELSGTLEDDYYLRGKYNKKKFYISKKIGKLETSYDYSEKEYVTKKLNWLFDEKSSLTFLDNNLIYQVDYNYFDMEKSLTYSIRYMDKHLYHVMNGSYTKEIIKDINLKTSAGEIFTKQYLLSLGIEVLF